MLQWTQVGKCLFKFQTNFFFFFFKLWKGKLTQFRQMPQGLRLGGPEGLLPVWKEQFQELPLSSSPHSHRTVQRTALALRCSWELADCLKCGDGEKGTSSALHVQSLPRPGHILPTKELPPELPWGAPWAAEALLWDGSFPLPCHPSPHPGSLMAAMASWAWICQHSPALSWWMLLSGSPK